MSRSPHSRRRQRAPRMTLWTIIALCLLLALAAVRPEQLQVVLYKALLVTLAAVIGYWLDRGLFPYREARPHECIGGIHIVGAWLRRALIVLAVVLGHDVGALTMRNALLLALASVMGTGWVALAFLLAAVTSCHPVQAADAVPAGADQYRRTLVRAAHAEWGLDAPVATLAGQVHQESRWRSQARSPAGAQGLAQFMPATADWMAELYPNSLGPAQPYNPGWALRAMVAYDRWLYARNQATSNCERWAFVLSAYNGGLGWVNRDRKLASAKGADKLAWFDSVERHNAGRSAANFRENRHYPRAILLRWEPMYAAAGWGPGVCAERYSRETSHALSAGNAYRQYVTCRLFPELARCQRAVRIAASARPHHAALAAQVQA